MKEKCLLLGVFDKKFSSKYIDRRMSELSRLAYTASVEVFESIIQKIDKVNPTYFIGKGKVYEIKELIEQFNIDVLICSANLTPVQHRNLENTLNIKVIDRNELIIIIFSKNANTAISKIECELAQYRYLLPRLAGKGIHLSRTGGGIGTRGPGEQKLEIDRRCIQNKIHILKQQLKKYEKDSLLRLKQRDNVFKVSLLGYTNAGKTTLMNVLTKEKLETKDKLFTTLNTVTRKFLKNIVITDTVGFLGELPHEIINSFKMTLNEAINTDLQLIVVSLSEPYAEDNLYDVNKTLELLNANNSNRLYVFNKMDQLYSTQLYKYIKHNYPNSVFISAKTGYNIEQLKNKILDKYLMQFNNINIRVKGNNNAIIDFIMKYAYIKKQIVENGTIYFELYFNNKYYNIFRKKFAKEVNNECIYNRPW